MSAIPTDIIEQLAAARVAQGETTSGQDEAEVRTRIRTAEIAKRRAEFERVARLNGAVVAQEPAPPPAPGKALTRQQKQRLKRDKKRVTDDAAAQRKSLRDEELAAGVQRQDIAGEVWDGKSFKPAVIRGARVEEQAWDDPADKNPNAKTPWQVRGFRRRDGLRDLKARKAITDAQWTAAEQFRDDLEAAEGARAPAEAVTVSLCTSPGYGPAFQQLAAQDRVRGAWRAVGLVLSGVFSWVVVSQGSVRDYETCKSLGHGTATPQLRKALDQLGDFYAGRTTPVVQPRPTPDPTPRREIKPRVAAEPFEPWSPPTPTAEALEAARNRLLGARATHGETLGKPPEK